MDTYKKKIRTRTNLLSLMAIGIALIYLGLLIYRDYLPVLPSFIKGFHQGAFIGIELMIVFLLGKYIKARKDETELKKMHIEESDERTSLILQKASVFSIAVIFFGLSIATIISGFFSAVIFFTLVSTLIFILVVFYALWIYFARKL